MAVLFGGCKHHTLPDWEPLLPYSSPSLTEAVTSPTVPVNESLFDPSLSTLPFLNTFQVNRCKIIREGFIILKKEFRKRCKRYCEQWHTKRYKRTRKRVAIALTVHKTIDFETTGQRFYVLFYLLL